MPQWPAVSCKLHFTLTVHMPCWLLFGWWHLFHLPSQLLLPCFFHCCHAMHSKQLSLPCRVKFIVTVPVAVCQCQYYHPGSSFYYQ